MSSACRKSWIFDRSWTGRSTIRPAGIADAARECARERKDYRKDIRKVPTGAVSQVVPLPVSHSLGIWGGENERKKKKKREREYRVLWAFGYGGGWSSFLSFASLEAARDVHLNRPRPQKVAMSRPHWPPPLWLRRSTGCCFCSGGILVRTRRGESLSAEGRGANSSAARPDVGTSLSGLSSLKYYPYPDVFVARGWEYRAPGRCTLKPIAVTLARISKQ